MSSPVTHESLVSLSAGDVCVVVEVVDRGLPAFLHWGPALDGLDAGTVRELQRASRALNGPNDVDVPVRLSILPEATTGWTGRPGLEGSRDGRGWSSAFKVNGVRLDGTPVSGWVDSGPALLEVTAVDAELELELEILIELLPTGLLRSRATVRNASTDASVPFGLDSLVLAYPVPDTASELLDFAGRWGRERVPQRSAFTVGTHLRENRKGRTGADSAYVLHAGTPGFGFADGALYAVHTAWSGNHVHYAERSFRGERVIGGGELLLTGEVRLAAGESYRSPWLYGAYGVGLDAIARRFHRHLRSRPHPVSADRPVTLNVWEAVTFDHDVDRLLDLADRAAKVGAERFVLDDGWFGARRNDLAGLGDWVVSREVWPQGLHPLVDRVRSLGMEFGLWVEPEMVNADSDVARAHPEWVMSARTEWPTESRHQQVLDLAIPAAYDHVKGQLLALLGEYDIGYLKWDHNRDLVESGNQLDGGRPAVHAQTLALYRLLDELREAHPSVEIESCSSGGGRVDLEILERTDRVWVSDNIDPLERQYMLRWTTQLIPPEYMGSHIASGRSHTTGRVHDLEFRAGTAIFGHLGIEWDLAQASDDELDELRAWVEFYQAHRDLLLTGDVVRMDTADPALFAHGVVSPDRGRAVFSLAWVGWPDAQPGPAIRLRGLSPSQTYRLEPVVVGRVPTGIHRPLWWGEDHARPTGVQLSGAALEHVGVAAPVIGPDQVVLLTATAVPSLAESA